MADINCVIDGANTGKEISTMLGNIFINLASFKSVQLSKKTVDHIEIVKVDKYNDTKSYTISLSLKTDEKFTLFVDHDLYENFLKIWPELKIDRLKYLLQNGYNIVGFSSFNFASSGLGAGAISHNILLQKGSSIEKVSYVTIGDKQYDAPSHIFCNEEMLHGS